MRRNPDQMKRLLLPALCAIMFSCSPERPAEAPSGPRDRRELRQESEPEQPDPLTEAGTPPPATAPAVATAPTPEPVPRGPWPFVGRRSFETRPAISGTGTPHRVVEINENGDVFFEYGQQNPQKGTMDGEKYAAGKFSRILKCEFLKLDEVRYYIIGHTAIVEVDETGKRIKDANCCFNKDFDQETECGCQGDLFRVMPE